MGTAVTLAGAAALALVHAFAGRLRFLDVIPRSRWLSAASGVSVAFIFVHVLPDLSRFEEPVRRGIEPLVGFLEHEIYLVALLGLAIFYALERAAKRSRQANRARGAEDATGRKVFWLHIASFTAYNALVGYLLVHGEEGKLQSFVLFCLAMALHFVVNDYGLRQDHQAAYHRTGRWVLAAAVLVGWAVGSLVQLPEVTPAVLFAFLAGGVIMNTLKEELPEERQSNLWAFLIGAGAYTALLIAR